MPIFQYEAVDPQGQTVKGTANGESMDAVAKLLTDRGLSLKGLSIAEGVVPPIPPKQMPPEPQTESSWTPPPTEARSRFETEVAGPLVGEVPLTRLHFFFRQLATMLHAGINPAQALETLSKQSGSLKLSRILLETKEHVIAGRPMSAGFQRYPEVFTPLMMAMVRAGEEGGFLESQCLQLSEYLQREIELRNMIRRETLWPKITVAASIFIILAANGVMSLVAPGGQRLESPLTTLATWFILGPLIIGGFLFVKVGLKNPAIKYKFDDFNLKIPGIGGMIHGFAMAKFGRAFGALYKGGVPMQKAVLLAADACGNEALRARMYPAAQRLQEGEGITDTFAQTGAFSPIVLDMTRTGETTGNMDQMLNKVAEYYEEEGAMKAQISAKIIGVVCLLLVAIYVAFVVIKFYMAYFAGVGAAGAAAGE